jgi:hypothetical protein
LPSDRGDEQARLALDYIVRGLDNTIKAAAKSTGIASAAFLSIHDDVFFNPQFYRHRHNSPYEHLLRRVPPEKEQSFLHKALEICKNGIAHKNYGLSLVDILQFDNATLSEIEKHFETSVKAQNNALEDLQADLAKAPKQLKGDQS